MGVETINRVGPRTAAACPWCGAGTALEPIGDGLGNVALTCTACGCKGPAMPIRDEFAAADQAAVARWSSRSSPAARLAPDAVERIARAVAVHRLLHGAGGTGSAVPVRIDDLVALLRAANVPLA